MPGFWIAVVALGAVCVLVAVGGVLVARRGLGLVRAEVEAVARAGRLDRQAADLERTSAELERRALALDQERARSAAVQADTEAGWAAVEAERQRLAGLTEAEARAEIVERAERQAATRAGAIRQRAEQEARRQAERTARGIVTDAVARVAVEQSNQVAITAVDLPSEEIKGRIIGREGRNVRAFEQLTGATLIIDDTPGSVLVSCFDPERRATAVAALRDLVADGRIHPSSIESAYERAHRGALAEAERAASAALVRAGVGDVAAPLLEHLVRLHHRSSYGQNVLEHSIEAAQLAAGIAAELGWRGDLCRRAAFLHDIGKAVTPSRDGTHAALGAELARRCGEPDEVVNAIAAHHGEVEPTCPEAVVTQIADAISGARPGARQERLEDYFTRLERLESLASEHPGVERVFAMRAGREIRVMVVPEVVDDEGAGRLAADIAHRIESELVYPGHIQVTVVRESRATATAV
ncbi:MAG: ribonuclease Y [Propionibacteriaceae bacterium]|nr:ribonuclease Y [Propionibacteriaceae bacterium]